MIEFWRKITKTDIRNTMAMAWVIGSFIFLFKIVEYAIPDANKDVAIAAVGFVLGKLGTIVDFFFIQSKSEVDEKRKDVQ